MFQIRQNTVTRGVRILALATIALALIAPTFVFAKDKKKDKSVAENPAKLLLERLDYGKIVWPNPPAIARVKFMTQITGEKSIDEQGPKKSGWMDRMAGVATGETSANKPRFQLLSPYGVGVDSKGRIYVADAKVGGIFIFNAETKETEMIKNGVHARFKLITGLAIDDADQVFVSDSVAKHVVVFDPQHRAIASISEGMSSPAGLAVDNENRFLYVCDTDLDQVLVYDADAPFKLLRRIGTAGKDHTLTEPGQLARPTNAAVDADGNLYVSDTFNDRVEIFDADGNFIRTFGKAGDGPGYFARPKGIAIDSDGHVWVADTVQDRIQVFTPEGRLLIYLGSHGELPGQFSTLAGLAIDKKGNRIVASEQWPGRVQVFRYVSDSEAAEEKKRLESLGQRKSAEAQPAKPAGNATSKQSVQAKTQGADKQ